MSLQEKVRYFQYMRPRLSNSFASGNMGASLGQGLILPNNSAKYITNPQLESPTPSRPVQKIQREDQPLTQSKTDKGTQNTLRRSKSNLSNYGTTSLRSLPKYVSQREIYQKQQKKYNIITILPKSYNETIKKYPKYRLENLDENYYRKLKLEEEYTSLADNPEKQKYMHRGSKNVGEIGGQGVGN